MGQKIHPYAFRIGVVNDWKSKWYSDKDYVKRVIEDDQIRRYLAVELRRGAVSRVEIERTRDRVVIEIQTARPGVVIGRKGAEAERLRTELERIASQPVKLNIVELKDADLDATLLAQGVADQLENRVAFRRAMKRVVQAAVKAGAEGVRVEAKGRLGGAEMGRREWYREGRVPLHTIRADVDFGTATARTTAGAVGIKVWVYKGDVVGGRFSNAEKISAEAALASGGPSRGRAAPVRARAEHAVGDDKVPRLIEAGGGKRLIEAGGPKKESGKRLIEAGGGKRRIDPDAAETEYREEKENLARDDEIEVVETEALEDVKAPETELATKKSDTISKESEGAGDEKALEESEESKTTKKPAAKKPAAKKPAAKKPAAKKPAAKKPAAKKPAAKKTDEVDDADEETEEE